MNAKSANKILTRAPTDGLRGVTQTKPDQFLTDSRMEKLLTYDEVADLLGVTARTVYTLVKRGSLTALKVGGSSRVDPRDLRLFIESAKVTSTPVDGVQ